MKFRVLLLIIAILFISLTACRKGPGEGGRATITGRVYEYNYNGDFSIVLDSYFKAEQDVYIVYGDDNVYADRFRTHRDGTFEFSYLLPGDYTIYTYSDDPTNGTTVPIVVEKKVQITSSWETVNTDTLIIYN